ncbi:hypothetical protein [Mycobacterium attenuatum]|uniref:hypothetical protein n=1 Tax=Mycobacterium attenuatum TaxID=2341086 RepID=UPI000F03784B|nr:hypothetical protein [Mycobacterium attenuatum]VBA62390.1 hypothetical protein LAUMK41_05781 [Mycobacterium attenuatum]
MTHTEHVVAWLCDHPRLRRALILAGSVHVLCLWAVACAPNAAAETGAAALGWTGLKDTYGVPLKDYFLSVVDTSEAMTNNGQHISAIDPSTWLPWLADATQIGFTHSLVALILTTETGALVFIFATSFWFLRFANSSAWLGTLATLGRPLWQSVNTLINDMWLGPLALLLCTCVAGYHYMRGRVGRAYSVAGNAAMLTALWWTVFRNPIDDLTSEHGLLGTARWTGFHLARSASTTSYAPGQSLDNQLNGLISQLISATVRPMVQLMNFGMVIDDAPGCAAAWSRAVMNANGQGAGPAHAMKGCGAVEALAHAQQLGANDIGLGVVFIVIALAVALFIWYAGITTLLVGVKATYYGIVVVPAFLAGMMGFERPKRFAAHAGSQLPLHAVQMIIFTTFLAVSSVAMRWALTTPLYGHGQLSVVPRLMLIAIGSIVALLAFHYIDKHFYTDSLGTIGHQISGAWHSVRSGAQAQYGDFHDGLDKMRDARDRYRSWRNRGNEGDDDTEATEEPQGQDVPGFEVVKPRPSRTMGAPAGQAAAETAAESATVAGEASQAATVAEAAGMAAAPEVAIPAAAVATVAHHAREHPNHNTSPDGQPDHPSTQPPHSGAHRAPEPAAPDDAAGQPPADADLFLPPVAARPVYRPPHHDDPPLEFPTAPPRPTARKGDRP